MSTLIKPFFILVGASATGKTTLAHDMCFYMWLREVVSHTTRAKRVGELEDVSYHFVTHEEMQVLNLVEHVVYDEHEYGSTAEEIAKSDIIVAEPTGARILQRHCVAIGRPVYTIGLISSENDRRQRMLLRGDSPSAVEKRIKNDADVFTNTIMLGLCNRLFDTPDYARLYKEVSGYIHTKTVQALSTDEGSVQRG